MNTSGPKIQYIDPTVRSYQSHYDHLIEFNESHLAHHASELTQNLSDLDEQVAIVTTGSDARREKGPESPLEIVLYARGHPDIAKVAKKITDHIEVSGGELYTEGIEVKRIDQDKMSEWTNYLDGHTVAIRSPNRVLDAEFMMGNPAIIVEAEKAFVNELRDREYGKKIAKELKRKVNVHRNVTESGVQSYKGKQLQHYDFDMGVAYYDPTNGQWSMKQGPLRAVQFRLVRDIVTYIREGGAVENVLQLPANTKRRLMRLKVEDLSALTHDELTDLVDNYMYFTWIYHRSQAAYRHGESVLIQFDAEETKERCADIKALTGKRIIK